MGTSTVHRSPSSPHWRVVNNLYRDPSIARDRLLAEIFRASADPYVGGLGGPETAHTLNVVLHTLSARQTQIGVAEALRLSSDLLARNREFGVSEGWSLFYGDLANRALHATVLSTSQDPTISQADLVRTFVGHVVATCIDHVVSRDLSKHLGESAVPNASSALKLSGELKAAAREIAADPELGKVVDAAASKPEANWSRLVSTIWKVGAAHRRGSKTRK